VSPQLDLPDLPGGRLGRGWPFPPAPARGRLDWRNGPDLVRQSVLLILATEPGERVMRPDFGCGLSAYLMEPNSPATRAGIARDVAAALRRWEPRIEVDAVDVVPTDDAATVLVSVAYTHVLDARTDAVQMAVVLGGG
jgi:phage baseplate assembly protein W